MRATGSSVIGALVGASFAACVSPAGAQQARAGTQKPTEECFPEVPVDGPGSVDPFRPTRAAAAALNVEGRNNYRKGLWEAARQNYRAAERADPDFLAPALNVACSFVRQERFAEATAEVVRLVERAYVPWRDEILAAADIGALKVRPDWASVEAAFARSRERWASELSSSVVFVARTGKPLGLGDAASGVLLLAPKQEIFAWSPRTLRTRQLTHEEGRVLAMLPSRDRQRVAYVVAEKLVRADGRATALRGVTAVVLDLRHLESLGRRAMGGDLHAVTVLETPLGFAFQSETQAPGAPAWRFEHGSWTAATRPPSRPPTRASVHLVPTGVPILTSEVALDGGCPMRLRERAGEGGVRSLTARLAVKALRAPSSPEPGPVSLGGRENGAGLFGLSIP